MSSRSLPATALSPLALLAPLALAALLGVRAEARSPEPEEPRLLPVLGRDESVLVEPDQTLLDIAFARRLGFEAVQRLNPRLDPWIPPAGSVVQLPTRFLLPVAPNQGLVINIPEMRLFDFTVEPFELFAIAIGDAADPSLIGTYRVGEKRVDPAWHVPRSIREEKPELPAVVPPGPDNPLGSRWITIGRSSYGIHGTNVRWSIGREATHGCIRLYDDEVKRLYDRLPKGTPIRLLYQPFKWGRQGDTLLLEAHPDVYGIRPDRLADALATPRALGLLDRIDLERVWKTVEEARGVPVAVGTVPVDAARRPPTSTPRS